MVMVPRTRSLPAMVSGMRSPASSMRRMMNWPGRALRATAGACTSMSVTVSCSARFLTIWYMGSPFLLSV